MSPHSEVRIYAFAKLARPAGLDPIRGEPASRDVAEPDGKPTRKVRWRVRQGSNLRPPA